MENSKFFTIGHVSKQTGIAPHLIRIWEKRYKVVAPSRTSGGRRLYNRSDVERLKSLKRAVENENAISFVSKLSSKDLNELSNPSKITRNDRSNTNRADFEIDGSNYYLHALSAIEGLDFDKLETTVTRAALKLTRMEFLKCFVLPLVRELRHQLVEGKIGIVHERIATTMMQSILFGMLQTTTISETAPKIIVTSPSCEFGELSALSVALIASETGCKPHYIGINLPVEEIGAVVTALKMEIIGIGITQLSDGQNPLGILNSLNSQLNRPMFVLYNGKNGYQFESIAKYTNISFCSSIDDLRRDLNAYVNGKHMEK